MSAPKKSNLPLVVLVLACGGFNIGLAYAMRYGHVERDLPLLLLVCASDLTFLGGFWLICHLRKNKQKIFIGENV